ncbi:MAG: hypothetical protein H6582_08240 [Crocinitomicaceae bacterium]|nr:hypothetical protein [Crocinitomicaceae bacterium]
MWLSILGLILDMVGVIIIFTSENRELPKIQIPPIRAYTNKTILSNPDKPGKQRVDDLITETNKVIESANENNRKLRTRAKAGLLLIVLGFSLQIIGLLMGQ